MILPWKLGSARFVAVYAKSSANAPANVAASFRASSRARRRYVALLSSRSLRFPLSLRSRFSPTVPRSLRPAHAEHMSKSQSLQRQACPSRMRVLHTSHQCRCTPLLMKSGCGCTSGQIRPLCRVFSMMSVGGQIPPR